MIRKVEKGEPLKVGDRLDIYGFSGTVTMIDDARPNYDYFNFCVEWPGCSGARYCSADPFIERALLATAVITREEPEGKWMWDDGRFRGPDRIHRSRAQVIDILNDQAATIERLKAKVAEWANTLQFSKGASERVVEEMLELLEAEK